MKVISNKLISIEYAVLGDYGMGWEEVYNSDDIGDVLARLKEYRDNEPEYRHRAVSYRTWQKVVQLSNGSTKTTTHTIRGVLRKGKDY